VLTIYLVNSIKAGVDMSWFRHRPRAKQPEKQVPHRSSPIPEKHLEKIKEELPSKKPNKE
jgi:hypothetical protein